MSTTDLTILVKAQVDQAQSALANVNRGLQGVERSATRMGRVSADAGGQVGMLGAQFNDIGVMLASGQSPFLLAIQQGTQISQVLGPMGARGAVTALGGALMSMLNPVSLITIGSIAAGAAAIQWLTGMGDDAEDAEDRVRDLAMAVNDYGDAVRRANSDDATLFRDFGNATGAARELQMIEVQLARLRAERGLAQSVAAANEASFNVTGFDADQMRSVLDQRAALAEEAAAIEARLNDTVNRATQAEMTAARQRQEQIRALMSGSDRAALSIAALRDTLGITWTEAVKLGTALAAVDDDADPMAQAEGWRQVRIALIDAAGGVENLNAAGVALLETTSQAEEDVLKIAAADLASPAEQAIGPFQALADAAETIWGHIRNIGTGLSDLPGALRNFSPDAILGQEGVEAFFAGRSGTPAGRNDQALVSAVASAAARAGLDPAIVLAVMGVESGWNPGAVGGAGGNYQGLIQFGPWERGHYGVDSTSSIAAQAAAAVEFMLDRGVRPGDSPARYYASVLAGNADAVNAGDTGNGGRVANIMQFVQGDEFNTWLARAQALLTTYGGTVQDANAAVREADQAARSAAAARVQEEAATAAAARAYDGLVASMDPLQAAQQALAAGQEVVNAALQAGTITAAEADQANAMLQSRYAEAVEKLNELNPEIEGAREEWTKFSQGIADVFADTLVRGGSFRDGLASLWQQIAADFIRSRVLQLLSGLGGGAPLAPGRAPQGGLGSLMGGSGNFFSFSGGGWTGDAPRSGGLDGQGGFLAMLHPREHVLDTHGLAATGANAGRLMSGPQDMGRMGDMLGEAVAELRAMRQQAPQVNVTARSEPGVVLEVAQAVVRDYDRRQAPSTAKAAVRDQRLRRA